MNVLVTGAQGCIGAWVVKQLLERGASIVTYDVDPDRTRLKMIAPDHATANIHSEFGNIEDTQRLKSLVRDREITHIIHLAAVLMPFCHANPIAGGLVNVIGTLNIFEAARDAGRPVRVVYASSSAVWGPEEYYGSGKLTEADPVRPATHYGVFKQTNENNARVFFDSGGITSIGLRPWTVYGVGRDRGMTADPTLALRALAKREPFQIRLTGHMDLQYVQDVAETFVLCALSSVEGAHVFNLEGWVTTMEDFIEMLERFRPGARDLITCKGPQVPVAYRMDDSQLRAQVPNIPKTPLEEGVRKTLERFEELHAKGLLGG